MLLKALYIYPFQLLLFDSLHFTFNSNLSDDDDLLCVYAVTLAFIPVCRLVCASPLLPFVSATSRILCMYVLKYCQKCPAHSLLLLYPLFCHCYSIRSFYFVPLFSSLLKVFVTSSFSSSPSLYIPPLPARPVCMSRWNDCNFLLSQVIINTRCLFSTTMFHLNFHTLCLNSPVDFIFFLYVCVRQ